MHLGLQLALWVFGLVTYLGLAIYLVAEVIVNWIEHRGPSIVALVFAAAMLLAFGLVFKIGLNRYRHLEQAAQPLGNDVEQRRVS
jgi:hypothetical protein